jgi:hypothetical protein
MALRPHLIPKKERWISKRVAQGLSAEQAEAAYHREVAALFAAEESKQAVRRQNRLDRRAKRVEDRKARRTSA